MQRKHVAHTKMRTDMGMRRLHHLVDMKSKLIQNSHKNQERFKFYKASIEAHKAAYGPSEDLSISMAKEEASDASK